MQNDTDRNLKLRAGVEVVKPGGEGQFLNPPLEPGEYVGSVAHVGVGLYFAQ